MNEKRIDLPSGGVAWLTTIADHRQANALKRIYFRIARYNGRDGKLRTDLTPEEHDDLENLALAATATNVRTFTTRWENVRAPNGDPLDLSAEGHIERMQERDIQLLFDSIQGALEEGGADPNARKPRSKSGRGTGRSPQTRTSAKD